MHEMFTNHPIGRKDVPCSSFSTLIRDETGDFFGLRALNRVIKQTASLGSARAGLSDYSSEAKLTMYGHISHYFVVLISCA